MYINWNEIESQVSVTLAPPHQVRVHFDSLTIKTVGTLLYRNIVVKLCFSGELIFVQL